MSIVDDSHLTDEVVNAAFEGTNFGREDFRTILAETVLKRAAGYHSGWTATTICMGLGLLSSKNQSATKLALTFAFHHYYKPCVREALMPDNSLEIWEKLGAQEAAPMSNINKQSLREQFEAWWEVNYHNGNPPRFGWEYWRDGDGYKIDDDESELDGMWESWQAAHSSKLEAAKKRIAELSHHLQCAHGFIEHTEAFGHEASNGILCCGDAQWNIDESKSVLAAAGKGE